MLFMTLLPITTCLTPSLTPWQHVTVRRNAIEETTRIAADLISPVCCEDKTWSYGTSENQIWRLNKSRRQNKNYTEYFVCIIIIYFILFEKLFIEIIMYV